MISLQAPEVGHTGPDEACVRLPSHVRLFPAPDGSARLIDLDGHFYALTPIATEMLSHALVLGPTVTAEKLAADHGVEVDRVRRDLAGFLGQLRRNGLLVTSAEEPRSRVRDLTSWILARVLRQVGRFRSLTRRTRAFLVLARLSLRLCGWMRTVAVWQQTITPPRTPPRPEEGGPLASAVTEAVRDAAARHFFGVTCKERSLACWAVARSVGLPASLVLGINLFPLSSHCWCESGGVILNDFPDRCADFVPLARYD